MTDEELVRACAEKVMGWYLSPRGFFWLDDSEKEVACAPDYEDERFPTFNPLNDDRDVCAVLDKMAEKGWAGAFGWHTEESPADERFYGEFAKSDSEGYRSGMHSASDRRRAVVIAALKAVGVEEC